MQYVIKSTRRAGSTHGNYIATAKLKPPLNGHFPNARTPLTLFSYYLQLLDAMGFVANLATTPFLSSRRSQS